MFDRTQCDRRKSQLKLARTSFEPWWHEVEDYILPGSTEFNTSDTNRGDKRSGKILNDTATDASRTLASGMMSGLTSPARPWFSLRLSDPDANDSKPTRVWLGTVTKRASDVFLRSNLYQVLPQFYEDLGSFAVGAFLVEEDSETVIRCHHMPVGSYWLGTSDRGEVDTCVRELRMTARQMVQKFGKEQCSPQVQTASQRNEDAWFDVTHFIEPNPDHDPKRLHSKFKAFRSFYYEPGADKPLREAGYDEFPVIAARWTVRGVGIYGNRCPGLQCLGDVKALQMGERRGWKSIDKLVDPPLTAPTSLKNSVVNQVPGGVTYVEAWTADRAVRPLYEINPHIAELDGRLGRVEARIRRAYFADLFLMLSNLDSTQPITAAEVAVRKEEKMLMLGPVLERLNDEAFDPLIKRVFRIMTDRGLLPDPPEELQGQELSIEYVSVLAQAQKLIGTAALEKLTGFIGTLLPAFPDVADKYDSDQAVDDYAAMVGAGPRTIRDAKEAAKIRQSRAQAQQAQQAMAVAQQGAQTAQTLSQTPLTEDTALGAMLGRMGAA